MAHKPDHNPPGQAGAQAFADALREIVETFRDAVAELAEAVRAEVQAELAAFRVELAALLETIGAEEPPAEVPEVPEEPPAEPEVPEVPDVVRREGGPSFDEFTGEAGVPEVFVLSGSDEVLGFVPGEDSVEVDAAAIGRSGEALVDFETATANGDLRLGSLGGEPVALLFTEDGVAFVEGATPLSSLDWIFA